MDVSNYLSDEDRTIYEASGFGQSIGFGKAPALLIIDIQRRTVGSRRPVLEAIEHDYPTACGERAWRAIDNLVPLLERVRAAGWPVIFPCVAPKDAGPRMEAATNPKLMDIRAVGYEFVDEVAPRDGDAVVPKHGPSGFFGTPLLRHLVGNRIDTLLIAGCTTSGCVRATTVDAFSANFRPIVVEDCVYDRAELSHQVGLFEMNAKYADVLPSDQVMKELDAL
ncbi:MAG: isochorismatase family protein [Propionibacteriales bacterium]|nr:isochorismatase family protein [Propionibacteriales bacterium]